MMCGKTYTRVLASHRIRSSLSRPANCWDNAVTESFFSPLNLDLFCLQSCRRVSGQKRVDNNPMVAVG